KISSFASATSASISAREPSSPTRCRWSTRWRFSTNNSRTSMRRWRRWRTEGGRRRSVDGHSVRVNAYVAAPTAATANPPAIRLRRRGVGAGGGLSSAQVERSSLRAPNGSADPSMQWQAIANRIDHGVEAALRAASEVADEAGADAGALGLLLL